MRRGREQFAAAVVPTVSLLSLCFVAYLTFLNVRQRVSEVGILRAFGVGAPRILGLFMVRAVAMGVLGAFLGLAVFHVLRLAVYGTATLPLLSQGLLLACTPLMAGAAAWLPALAAARCEPAEVLRHD
jgi:putative ABC transport system permease protein